MRKRRTVDPQLFVSSSRRGLNVRTFPAFWLPVGPLCSCRRSQGLILDRIILKFSEGRREQLVAASSVVSGSRGEQPREQLVAASSVVSGSRGEQPREQLVAVSSLVSRRSGQGRPEPCAGDPGLGLPPQETGSFLKPCPYMISRCACHHSPSQPNIFSIFAWSRLPSVDWRRTRETRPEQYRA